MGLLSVSIDVDEIDCYYAIHGLERPDGVPADVICRRALPRIASLLEEIEVPATFFMVGKDIQEGVETAALLRDLAGARHEIGNHSMNHRYDLPLLSQAEIAFEIDTAAHLIERTVGAAPKGFRAPGYNVHLGMTDLLTSRGYLYDSSVFPCPLYYAAKAGAIGVKALKGLESASLLGDPRILGAPLAPYRVGAEGVWTQGKGLIELPITVVTPARVPFIGTSLTVMGTVPATLLAKAAARLPFVNLELHGIDFAEADGDGFGDLKAVQPGLGIAYPKRRRTLSRVIKTLLDAGMEPLTLQDVAARRFIS